MILPKYMQVWLAATAAVEDGHHQAEQERQRLKAEAEERAQLAELWRKQQMEEARQRQEEFVLLSGGFTAALRRAVVADDVPMLELLAHNGGDLHETNEGGSSLLELAEERGRHAAVAWLRAHPSLESTRFVVGGHLRWLLSMSFGSQLLLDGVLLPTVAELPVVASAKEVRRARPAGPAQPRGQASRMARGRPGLAAESPPRPVGCALHVSGAGEAELAPVHPQPRADCRAGAWRV